MGCAMEIWETIITLLLEMCYIWVTSDQHKPWDVAWKSLGTHFCNIKGQRIINCCYKLFCMNSYLTCHTYFFFIKMTTACYKFDICMHLFYRFYVFHTEFLICIVKNIWCLFKTFMCKLNFYRQIHTKTFIYYVSFFLFYCYLKSFSQTFLPKKF